MPGLHRVEELGRSFALVETEPEVAVELAVHREPLAPLLLLGVVSAAAGGALGGRARWRSPLPAVGAVAPPPAAEPPGACPLLPLAVAAAGLGTPTALALAAGGATVLALGLTLTASAAVALGGR